MSRLVNTCKCPTEVLCNSLSLPLGLGACPQKTPSPTQMSSQGIQAPSWGYTRPGQNRRPAFQQDHSAKEGLLFCCFLLCPASILHSSAQATEERTRVPLPSHWQPLGTPGWSPPASVQLSGPGSLTSGCVWRHSDTACGITFSCLGLCF